MKFSGGSRTVAGLEWEDDGLTAGKTTLTTRTPPGVTASSLRDDEARARTWSLFGQHEIALNDEVTATVGARGYRVRSDHGASTMNGVANPTRRNSDSLVLGSLGVVWTPAERLSLRANLSQGYIYPTLGQLFLTTTGGGVTLAGNPDLKPETSNTFELGARYASGRTVMDATLFHGRSRDYIATVSSGTTGTYRNVDAAHSWGLELYAEHALGFWGLTPYTSFAAMRRQMRYGNGYETDDGGAPAFAGRIGLRKDWQWDRATGSVDLFLRGETWVRMRNENAALDGSAAGYGTLNLRAHADVGKGLGLVVELLNLGDRRYRPYGQMPGVGRAINLFVTKRF